MESIQQTILPLAALLGVGLLVFLRRRSGLAALRGPGHRIIFSKALLHLLSSDDLTTLCEKGVRKYGQVFKVPTFFGNSCVVVCDPKALSHIISQDGYTYRRCTFIVGFFKKMLGDTMVSSDGALHKKLRRSMAPAFSISALKLSAEVFYNSAYKVKAHWDNLSESNDDLIIDVQSWMNRLTFDTLNIAGFGFDFKTMEGNVTALNNAIDKIRLVEDPRPFHFFQFMGLVFPIIARLPLNSTKPFDRMKLAFMEMSEQVVENSEKQKDHADSLTDRSILGMLLKGQASNTDSKLLYEEVIGQGLFLFAGYETTSITLTWALIELARYPEIQEKLREEFRQFPNIDPSWEQLRDGLPYLNAFTQEVLRLHTATEKIFRTAGADDTVPLSTQDMDKSGKDVVVIPKGTTIMIPLMYYNRAESIWGPDAREFKPERWLGEQSAEAKEVTGRLYSFSVGPRKCLGSVFATIEIKVMIYILVRNFSFEFPDGKDTEIVNHRAAHVPRPKIPGVPGCTTPMRVKQISS